MSKIKCPNPSHDDQTPSFHLYEDGGYCFVCGYTEKGQYEVKKKEKENIEESIRAIKALPKVLIRELEFHADRSGYYIVWPDGSYYKKRLYDGRVRYIGPVGHKAPLLVLGGKAEALVIVEGEINALSLHHSLEGVLLPKRSIVSPGSASEFQRHLDTILTIVCKTAIVVVDKDPAGVAAGVELKRELMKHGKRVQLIACDRDINQMLQDGGKQEVQQWWKEEVGL